MAKYYIEMMIEFSGELEADSPEQAEQLAWESWGDTLGSQITYDGVYSIDVEEIEDEDEDEEDDEETAE